MNDIQEKICDIKDLHDFCISNNMTSKIFSNTFSYEVSYKGIRCINIVYSRGSYRISIEKDHNDSNIYKAICSNSSSIGCIPKYINNDSGYIEVHSLSNDMIDFIHESFINAVHNRCDKLNIDKSKIPHNKANISNYRAKPACHHDSLLYIKGAIKFLIKYDYDINKGGRCGYILDKNNKTTIQYRNQEAPYEWIIKELGICRHAGRYPEESFLDNNLKHIGSISIDEDGMLYRMYGDYNEGGFRVNYSDDNDAIKKAITLLDNLILNVCYMINKIKKESEEYNTARDAAIGIISNIIGYKR